LPVAGSPGGGAGALPGNLGNIFAELSVMMLRSILQTTSKNNDRKIDAERFEGHPTKRQQLEARIERLRQDASGMSDRETAAR
jgi:hypothetical protein